jgi:hypothetical protein
VQWRTSAKSHACASLDGVENRDTGIGRYADNPFQRFQAQNPCIAGLVELHAMLLDDPVIPEIRNGFWKPIGIAIGLRREGINVKPAALGHNQVGICRSLKLNRNIRFQARYVGLFHCAAKIDHDLSIGFLEIDQPGKHPEIAGSLRHGDAHRAVCVRRHRCAAKDIEAETLHLFHVEQQSASFITQRQAGLVAQKQLEAQFFFKPVDLPHQRRAGHSQDFRRIPEALMARAQQKRPQILP